MANEDYTTIKLPNELIERIEQIVNSNRFGFKSRAEFIKEAVRQELKYYATSNQHELELEAEKK